jgi:hypothetical protein
MVFILTACAQGSLETEATEISQAVEETEEMDIKEPVEETEEAAPMQENEEPAADESGAEDSDEQISSTEPADDEQFDLTSMSGCRSKEPLTVAYDVLSPPTEDDWALGSEDAYVTIIEYGDFQ